MPEGESISVMRGKEKYWTGLATLLILGPFILQARLHSPPAGREKSKRLYIDMLVPPRPHLDAASFRLPAAEMLPEVESYQVAVFSGSISGIPEREGVGRITAPPLTAVLRQQFAVLQGNDGLYWKGQASGPMHVESGPDLVWEPGEATITTLTNVFNLRVEQVALRNPQGFVLQLRLRNRTSHTEELTLASIQEPTIRKPSVWTYGSQFSEAAQFNAPGRLSNGMAVHQNAEGAVAFSMPGAYGTSAASTQEILQQVRAHRRGREQPSLVTALYRRFRLRAGEEVTTYVVLASATSPEAARTAVRLLMAHPGAAIARARSTMNADIRAWLGRLPAFYDPDPRVTRFYYLAALQLLYARWKVGKTFVCDPWYATSGLDSGAMNSYVWDLDYARVPFSLLDPSGMRAMLIAMAGGSLDAHYSIEPTSGQGTGVFYSYDPYAFTSAVDEYLRVTGDRSILSVKRKGKTLLDWLIKMARFGENELDQDGNHLLDYGTDRNLLEIKTTGSGPGYIHEVPSPNAERSYVYDTVADILAEAKNPVYQKTIEEFRKRAKQAREAVNKILWLEGPGWYGCRQKDGKVVPIYSIQVFDLLRFPGIVPLARAKRLVQHLNRDEFLGPWGIRSLSVKDRLWDWTDHDWSGPMTFIGDEPQLIADLFQAGFVQKAWQAFGKILWWPEHLAILPQGIANDDYRFMFPQSASFGGRISAGRTNEISGATGVEVIIRGIFGVRPGRDGSISFSMGLRPGDGPIALSYPYRGRIWDVTQRHEGLGVRRDDGFQVSLFREDGSLRFSFRPRSVVVWASARAGGSGELTVGSGFLQRYFGLQKVQQLEVDIDGHRVNPQFIAGWILLTLKDLEKPGIEIEFTAR
jgi:hypothetical protein